jgi:predicted AAA+ superfamily ATPase
MGLTDNLTLSRPIRCQLAAPQGCNQPIRIKTAVDRDRRPGRFILTGSANVLLFPRLSDSLAGRMEILRLHPLSQAELERTEPGFLDRLFGDGFVATSVERMGRDGGRRE